jgi:hypothetical protein
MLETLFPAPVGRRAIRLVAAAGVLTLACGGARPPVRTIRLESTGDTLITPYGEITDAAWLGGKRWVLVSPQDRMVGVADLEHRSLQPFGGARARELEQPYHLFRAGDSVYVADWQRRRLTSWSLAGAPGSAYPAPDRFRGVLPSARDMAGQWYLESRAAPGPDGQGNLDSAVVLRATPGLDRGDTVARLAPFDMVEVEGDGRRRLERRLLSGQDRWGVLPDGRVWVARVGQNRIDWRDSSGRVRRGDELPDRVLPITQNDRDVFLNHFEVGLRTTVEQIPFAAIKPPFETALTDPDGIVWLVKSRAIGDTVRSYQLVDAAGRLVGEASHPGLGRILAMGGGYALVGEPIAAGVRLRLFRVPAAAAADTQPRSNQ